MQQGKRFQLDKRNGKLAGVCAGLASYAGVDVTLIRVAVVVLTLLGGFPWTLIAYGVAASAAKPAPAGTYVDAYARGARASGRKVRAELRDIDRRMAEVESYVTTSNGSLAREIEKLR